jgi:hypothetical protein
VIDRNALLLAAIVASVACQSNETAFDVYPVAWGAVPVPNGAFGCRSVSGIYENLGEISREFPGPVTLRNGVFAKPMGTAPVDAVQLSFESQEGNLYVNYDDGRVQDETNTGRGFSVGASCESGWIVVRDSRAGSSDGTWVSSTTESRFMFGDTYLIVRFEYHRDGGAFMPESNGLAWMRFPRAG